MSNLASDVKMVLEFLEGYPNIENAAALSKSKLSLEKALKGFLLSTEELRLELQPLYPELSSLIESKNKGKYLASVEFMSSFAKAELGIKFAPQKSEKKTRKEFLNLVAKANKLELLKKQLDPTKPLRDEFIKLVQLDIQEIEKQLSAMKPKELSILLEANSIKFDRTAKGGLSKTKGYMAKILSQIKNMKQSEHF